jgi:hypothetical protein
MALSISVPVDSKSVDSGGLHCGRTHQSSAGGSSRLFIPPAWCFNGRMEDVTSFVLRYREAARHMWNCFLRDAPLDGPGLHDWESLKQVLFTALVLRNCGHDECAAALLASDRYGFSWIEPIAHLHVVPLGDVPILISRDPGPHCNYWDHAINRVGPNDVDLRFIDLPLKNHHSRQFLSRDGFPNRIRSRNMANKRAVLALRRTPTSVSS